MESETNFGSEVIALVKSDLDYGLTQEQTDKYLDKDFSIGQMRVLSECLRKEYPMELFKHLHDGKLSDQQMQVAFEFYEKKVPLETIMEVANKDNKGHVMRKLYEEVLCKLDEAKENTDTESEYVKSLIAKMEEVVKQINNQEERYDALNRKLSEIEISKDDEEVRAHLVEELQSKDAIINSQQDELNKASSTIARLRNENESKREEMKRMSDRIESLEDKIIKIATDNKKEAERKAAEENQESTSVMKDMQITGETGNTNSADSMANHDSSQSGSAAGINEGNKRQPAAYSLQDMPSMINGFPVYYQLPLVDSAGNIIQRLPIERTVRKSSNNGMAGLFARLSFKKKSRADIVKLVASGDLVPAQLVQIKSAIEKGLTECQLVELINNNLSADKMKEIIEIAVLENNMAD